MSRWMVNVRGRQFSASNMDELRKLARAGELAAGDIVQPPGASDWLYALDVPELKASLRNDVDNLPPSASQEMSPALKWGAAALLAAASAGVWYYALDLFRTVPDPGQLDLLTGMQALNYTEVLITSPNAVLRATASDSANEVGPLPKDAKAELLGKRGDWYRLRYAGNEGYARVTDVVPGYFFADEEKKLDFDPLFNPDQYVRVENAGWAAPPEGAPGTTVFTFLLRNESKFEMTDIKLNAVIEDKDGKPLEEKEIALEGAIPAGGTAMVGTLLPNKRAKAAEGKVMTSTGYEKVLLTDPTAAERWVDGVEIQLQSQGFIGAEVRFAEVRAVPQEPASN